MRDISPHDDDMTFGSPMKAMMYIVHMLQIYSNYNVGTVFHMDDIGSLRHVLEHLGRVTNSFS